MFAAWLAMAVLAGCGDSVTTTGNGAAGALNSTNENTSLPVAVAAAEQADTTVNPALVAADNAFGLNLLNTLIPANGGNVAISPLSVSMALQILYNGAGGTTQTAMAQALQLGNLSTPDLNAANAALLASLINPDSKVQLTIANSLWMHLSDNPVSAAFIQTDQTFYGATLGDLASAPGAPANVNAWVSNETDGLITQILPPANYNLADAVIADVIYFKGQWTTAFDVSQTAPAPFSVSDGTQTSAEMMHQSGSYYYLQGDNFQAMRLPYGQGRMSMLIVLPDAGTSVAGFVAGITVDQLNGWNAQMSMSTGSIALPRFTATFGSPLNNALTSLGMAVMFQYPAADFSGLAPRTYVSDVEHKTVIEIDETGTVAAAATTITVATGAVMANQFTMTMDHPFLYAIQDDKTGEILFIGILVDPTSASPS